MLLLAVLAVGDLVAKAYVENKIAEQVEDRLAELGGVEADIDSFPFVGRLLAFGSIPHLTLRLHEITGYELDVAELKLEIDDLQLDQRLLVGDAKIEVTGIDSAVVTAVIDEEAVERAASLAGAELVEVDFEEDQVSLTALGQTVTGELSVDESRIRLRAAGLPEVVVPLPSLELLPCEVDGEVRESALELSCEGEELPPIVVDAIGSIDLREGLE